MVLELKLDLSEALAQEAAKNGQLQRSRCLNQLSQAQVQTEYVVKRYAALARLPQPPAIEPVILRGPDDDAVLACAVGAAATKIISGDGDLLALKKYQDIEILRA